MLKDLWLVLTKRLSSATLEGVVARWRESEAKFAMLLAERRDETQTVLAIASRLCALNPELRYFAQPELDPKRKADSDALGKAVMDKMLAEHKARMHSEGKL